ncbi:zinc transporter ZupT [Candidatus Poribacteria bacterium]
MNSNFGMAMLLTVGAGLATTLGGVITITMRRTGPRFMGFTLGFSAGVMIQVALVELLRNSIESIGFLSAHVGFLLGMAGIFLIDFLVPHDYMGQHDHEDGDTGVGLMRVGILMAFGIGIHNLPEGMATFASTLEDLHLGIAIAVAIAIHNIPEGLAVSAPIYAATGCRGKACLWSFLAGMSGLLGALLAALILMPILTPTVLGWTLAAVAGIMVSLSIDELVPAAKAFGSDHAPIVGVITGVSVIAVSLWLLK